MSCMSRTALGSGGWLVTSKPSCIYLHIPDLRALRCSFVDEVCKENHLQLMIRKSIAAWLPNRAADTLVDKGSSETAHAVRR